jgi:hypothetical protein
MLSQKINDKRGRLAMTGAGKRKRGRPRKHAPGRRNLTVRVTKSAYQELIKAAAKNGRSVSEEIEFRVHEWAETKNMREEAKTSQIAAAAQLEVARIQAIRKAGCQIVRDAGGNVTVSMSPALLMTEAEGILRHQADLRQETDPAMQSAGYGTTPAAAPEDTGSGFVAEENIDKSPQEIMIQRVVERAIENALTKAGLIGRKGVA